MSYHEGSNWQAKKEDEGKPLYEPEKTKPVSIPVQGMDEFISHPLDTVIENCIHVNTSFKDMCLCLGLNDEGLREFLAERMPIDDKLATGLEKLLGVDKQFWINRQLNYNKKTQYDSLASSPSQTISKEGWNEIVSVYDAYIELLDKGYAPFLSLGYIHGLIFSKEDIDKGFELRNKIKELKNLLPSSPSSSKGGEQNGFFETW